MTSLGDALDAAAARAYGDGYEDLPLAAKHQVREHVLPMFNAVWPRVRNAMAEMVEARAESNELWGRGSAARALRLAAQDIRAWPE